MSLANAIASFGKLLQDAAVVAATAAGGPAGLDTDISSPFSEPYPSLRMHLLEDRLEAGESVGLVQVILRTLVFEVDEWQHMRFCAEMAKAWGFSHRRQRPGESLVDQLDFEGSDTPAISGNIRLELVGGKVWRILTQGEVRQASSLLNIYYKGGH